MVRAAAVLATAGRGGGLFVALLAPWIVHLATSLVLLATWFLARRQAKARDAAVCLPPWAPGLRLPFLGHALAYKADPPGFLR